MLQYILDLVARLGHWSYLIVFLVAALECAAFFGLLVPGESLMLAPRVPRGLRPERWLPAGSR